MKYAYLSDDNVILGWYDPAVHTEMPPNVVKITDDNWQRALQGGHNTYNPATEQTAYVNQQSFTELKKTATTQVQTEKSLIKNGGFNVNGTLFDSDDAAQVAYLLYASKFTADPTYVVENWKASTGQWVRMDATLFNQVVAGLETHLASCFAWQQAKEQEIAACTTEEELNAVSLVYGE